MRGWDPNRKLGGVGVPWGLVWLEIEGVPVVNLYEVTYSTSNQRLLFGMFYGMYKTKTPRKAHE